MTREEALARFDKVITELDEITESSSIINGVNNLTVGKVKYFLSAIVNNLKEIRGAL